jgi:hypothetical protein
MTGTGGRVGAEDTYGRESDGSQPKNIVRVHADESAR